MSSVYIRIVTISKITLQPHLPMLHNDINVLNGNTLQMDHVHLSIPIFKTILG